MDTRHCLLDVVWDEFNILSESRETAAQKSCILVKDKYP